MALKQISCALTKHTVPIEAEEKLFNEKLDRIETECEKCHTPLLLEIDPENDGVYFMSELIEEELEQ